MRQLFAATVATQFTYAFSLNGGESVRSQFVKIYLDSDNTVYAKDFEGKGFRKYLRHIIKYFKN